MTHQYVTDIFPTIKAPLGKLGRSCQPTLISVSPAMSCVRSNHIPNLTLVAPLLQFLAFFGNAVGRGPHFKVEGDQHFTVLNSVLVGATAKSRKGTSAGRIRQIFKAADGEWELTRARSAPSSARG